VDVTRHKDLRFIIESLSETPRVDVANPALEKEGEKRGFVKALGGSWFGHRSGAGPRGLLSLVPGSQRSKGLSRRDQLQKGKGEAWKRVQQKERGGIPRIMQGGGCQKARR